MAPPTRLVDRLPQQLRSSVILERIARVGAATPDQIACLITGQIPTEISTADSLRIHRKTLQMERAGLLKGHEIKTQHAVLRATERSLYRATARLEEIAAFARRREASTLLCIRDLPSERDGWIDEDTIWVDALPTWNHRRKVRELLRRLVRMGALEHRLTRPKGHVRITWVPRDGPSGWQWFRAGPNGEIPELPRRPRLDHGNHHLLTVHAAIQVLGAQDADLVSLLCDEALRSREIRGLDLRRGQRFASMLADGELTIRYRQGARQQAVGQIEVLTSKYTDEDIREKYAGLPPRTLFLATTKRLIARVAGLGLGPPYLLGAPFPGGR